MNLKILISSLVLFLTFSSSCVTQKKCLNKFPPSIDSIVIKERHDSIIYKDTIVTVEIPGINITDSIFIPCPNLPKDYVSDTLILKTDFAVSKSWVENNKLKATLEQPDTTLQFKLDNALQEAYYWESEYNKITEKPKPVKYIPKLYLASFFILLGEVIIIFAYLAFKFLK